MATIEYEFNNKKEETLTRLTFADIREGTVFLLSDKSGPYIKARKMTICNTVNLVTGEFTVVDPSTPIYAYVDTIKMNKYAFKEYKEQVELFDRRILNA